MNENVTPMDIIKQEFPVGCKVYISDGTKRPPERFNRKLREWKSNNYEGIVEGYEEFSDYKNVRIGRPDINIAGIASFTNVISALYLANGHCKRLDEPKAKTFRFISDPGHAWLEVTREELNASGVAPLITPYSYQHGEYVYLEEDQDAGTFLNTLKGQTIKFDEVYQERTPIRNYQSYNYQRAA